MTTKSGAAAVTVSASHRDHHLAAPGPSNQPESRVFPAPGSRRPGCHDVFLYSLSLKASSRSSGILRLLSLSLGLSAAASRSLGRPRRDSVTVTVTAAAAARPATSTIDDSGCPAASPSEPEPSDSESAPGLTCKPEPPRRAVPSTARHLASDSDWPRLGTQAALTSESAAGGPGDRDHHLSPLSKSYATTVTAVPAAAVRRHRGTGVSLASLLGSLHRDRPH